MFEGMAKCLKESDVDSIEIALKKRKAVLISEGDLETADRIEDVIRSLDHVTVCQEPARGFASMMRDRAR